MTKVENKKTRKRKTLKFVLVLSLLMEGGVCFSWSSFLFLNCISMSQEKITFVVILPGKNFTFESIKQNKRDEYCIVLKFGPNKLWMSCQD